MRLDLHLHSTASDGAWAPSEVVQGAAKGGLDVIAITDHDTTAAFEQAEAPGREVNVQVIPAIEVSSTHGTQDIHVLGYFVDPDARALRRHEEKAVRRREERMREMLDKLSGRDVHLSYEAVLEAAGDNAVAVARPHLARALVDAGHVSSEQEAFDTLIGDRSPAFVPTHLLAPIDAVEVVLAAGGVAVWAHPPTHLIESLLGPMIQAGLRGIEVYRPRNRPALVQRLERVAETHELMTSGGSDWHTPDRGAALGDFYVTADEVGRLLEAGGM